MKRVAITLITVVASVFLLVNLTLADTIDDYRELLVELRLDTVLLAKFNLLFDLNLQLSGGLNRQEFLKVIQVVTDENYNKEIFLNALDKTADLLASLKQDNSLLFGFNNLFSTDILSLGNPTPEQTEILFNLAADPNFNRETFLTALPRVNNLYIALNANQQTLTLFNEFFDTQISSDSNLIEEDRATLFSLAAAPEYNQEIFIAALPKANNLVEVIKVDEETAEKFNNIFSTEISDSTTLTAQDKGVIFDVVATPTFNQEDFLEALPKADSLLGTLTSDSVALEEFNKIFDTAISSQEEIPASERGILFDVAAPTEFNEESFVAALPKAGNLLEAIEQ